MTKGNNNELELNLLTLYIIVFIIEDSVELFVCYSISPMFNLKQFVDVCCYVYNISKQYMISDMFDL